MLSFIKRAWNFLFGKKEEKVTTESTKQDIKVDEPKVVKIKKDVLLEKVTAKEIKSGVNKPKTKREPKFKASKAAIKLAKENGIDLTKVTGTGKEGNITVADINKLID